MYPITKNNIKVKRQILLSLIIITALFLTTCKKTPEIPTGSSKIEIGKTVADTVSYFTATISTTITATGGNKITQHGHCWSTHKNPSTEDNKTSLGTMEKPGTFNSELNGLIDNTTYYIRSYFVYKNGIVYGSEQTIKTLKTGKPVLGLTEVKNVELFSAHFSGTALADNGLSIIIRGFCWDTVSNFSLVDCMDTVNIGKGIGDYETDVNTLNEGLTYYVKSFAINSKGVSYSVLVQFSTIPITAPEVVTTDIIDITINSATSGGNVTSNGNGTVTARGVCWNTSGNPTLQNSFGYTTEGGDTGSFTSNITGLSDNTTYYVAAYSTNEKGTAYGEVKQFNTLLLSLPTVTTTTPTNITANSATSGGNVTSNGNGTVTARGVCWNTYGNPTLQNNIGYTTDGSGTSSFTSPLTGLNDETTYYVRAYAINEKGTTYGEVKQFITLLLSLPTVTTTTPTNITANSATGGGNVTSNGNGTVTARGVCWNTTNNPTLQNNLGYTTDGGGIGSFTSNITGLSDNTTYYVAAYSTNEKGTAYGEIIEFATAFIKFTDPRDGQIYKTIVIGSQTWFAENLNYESSNSWWYNNSAANGAIYGRLYTWDAAQTACPSGWHLPSDDEWTTLTDFLGGSSVAGGKMKETGTTHWNSPNTGATNSSGFTALPGGYRNSNGSFLSLGNNGSWWSSTENSGTRAWNRNLYYGNGQVGRYGNSKTTGFSVRCLKN